MRAVLEYDTITLGRADRNGADDGILAEPQGQDQGICHKASESGCNLLGELHRLVVCSGRCDGEPLQFSCSLVLVKSAPVIQSNIFIIVEAVSTFITHTERNPLYSIRLTAVAAVVTYEARCEEVAGLEAPPGGLEGPGSPVAPRIGGQNVVHHVSSDVGEKVLGESLHYVCINSSRKQTLQFWCHRHCAYACSAACLAYILRRMSQEEHVAGISWVRQYGRRNRSGNEAKVKRAYTWPESSASLTPRNTRFLQKLQRHLWNRVAHPRHAACTVRQAR